MWTCVVAVGTWEVGVGAGRFCRTSSGGGTGKTTGEALEGSLLTNKTSMGPDVLLRRIWYFRCPLRTCTHSRRHEQNNNRTRERRGKSTRRHLQILVWAPLAACLLEHGWRGECHLWREGREWEKLLLSEKAKCLQIQACETITFKCSTEIFVFYVGHSMNVLSAAATQTQVLSTQTLTMTERHLTSIWKSSSLSLKEKTVHL